VIFWNEDNNGKKHDEFEKRKFSAYT